MVAFVKNPTPVPYYPRAISVWHYNPENDLFSGSSHEAPVEEFVDAINRYGHAIVVLDRARAVRHNLIGSGVGHNDADFCERGNSMAVYYENGETHNGERWWETSASYIRQHYFPAAMREAESRRVAI